jgi:hypothetical protein
MIILALDKAGSKTAAFIFVVARWSPRYSVSVVASVRGYIFFRQARIGKLKKRPEKPSKNNCEETPAATAATSTHSPAADARLRNSDHLAATRWARERGVWTDVT